MTFGNPSCSAGAAGEVKARSLELLLFGFSFNPRGTRVNEEEENRSRMSSLSATEQTERRREKKRRESAPVIKPEKRNLTFALVAEISREKGRKAQIRIK